MGKSSRIKLGYDLELYERTGGLIEITADIYKQPHWLICGDSGSGKSYFMLYALRNILFEHEKDVIVYMLDFKGEDYCFMKNYSHYYSGNDCTKGIEDYYEEFLKKKEGIMNDNKVRIMIFDEYAAYLLYLSQVYPNKEVEKIKGYISIILLMGRSMHCNIVTILQRSDVRFIDGFARSQYFITVAMGHLSSEFKRMVMQGEELEQREVYAQGEGIVLVSGRRTRFLKVPRLRSVERVKQQILDCLPDDHPDTAEGGGG